MRQQLGTVPIPMGAHVLGEDTITETVSHFEQDLNDLTDALALLGVKRCGRCRRFFRCTEPGVLFENGHSICYGCIPDWWSAQSARLPVSERERTLGKLAVWLRKYHQAEVVKETAGAAPEAVNADFQIVANCAECGGSGKLMEGERCRFCNGAGTVRIVVPK